MNQTKMKKAIRYSLRFFLFCFLIGLIIPQNMRMPVQGATSNDYNKNSFWYYPWGKSGTHKGIDIFAKKGTTMNSSTWGIKIFSGQVEMGGNVVLILGPKWRFHYYAHLDELNDIGLFVNKNTQIGTVGDSGNAVGKQAHLHYSILTSIPYPWRIDGSPQGWKKMFYLNPMDYL